MVVNSQSNASKDEKPRLSCMDKGPGPGKYSLPSTCGYKSHDITRRAGPAYSFGTRFKQFSSLASKPHSPGPAHFVAPQFTRKGKDGSPAYSIYGRPRSLTVQPTPSPAAYSVKNIKEKHPPAYSMGSKLSPLSRPQTPAPNAYSLPSVVGKGNSAAYSLTGRSKIGSFHQDLKKEDPPQPVSLISLNQKLTPGPGSYKIIAVTVTRVQSPCYSMGSRVFPPEAWKATPGPAAYNAEKVTAHKRSSPAYSLSIRHSEHVAPVVDKTSS